ncbi:hypothetical protein [Pedomonas mirosovicensis]|uniref:hypothetical protein n=1 Tax=Pedomonas mirosovicensis TaxID=2908641 RepID=UPI00216A113F|nr:hypothetical protein [Pedomonas mirosovicensis]MCH8686627.1 hypothetical protein [Pedomonas mirosovicensis]
MGVFDLARGIEVAELAGTLDDALSTQRENPGFQLGIRVKNPDIIDDTFDDPHFLFSPRLYGWTGLLPYIALGEAVEVGRQIRALALVEDVAAEPQALFCFASRMIYPPLANFRLHLSPARPVPGRMGFIKGTIAKLWRRSGPRPDTLEQIRLWARREFEIVPPDPVAEPYSLAECHRAPCPVYFSAESLATVKGRTMLLRPDHSMAWIQWDASLLAWRVRMVFHRNALWKGGSTLH